ncbi:kinesin-like protein KIN-14Q isoform X2 [Prosopis cineraria]|uniref:kinesin-like protein KIN-14Q isoform X2 n=1 Tax=Prosopis cineraria TaxID=364024 RepID=UPI0024103ECA|nr:kinesin-like protein KIN-14Q isoform X2 [Prosopis cineraria]
MADLESEVHGSQSDGQSILGNSLTPPDLVICAASPDITSDSYVESPELLENKIHQKVAMELSLENGINESVSGIANNQKTPTVKFSNFCQTFKELSPEASFELPPPPIIQYEPSQVDPSGENELLEDIEGSQQVELEPSNDAGDFEFLKLKREFDRQKKDLAETRRVLKELKRENQQKDRECQEAWKSFNELQNELMRKSMHVGSLAFAVEGQVKEKGRWFSALKDLIEKVKVMKVEYLKLSEEIETYKKYLADMSEVELIIMSKINGQQESHEDLKSKYLEGAKQQKELYNKVLELRGNIRVFCRCRPLNAKEITAGLTMAVGFESAKDGELTVMSNGTPRKTYKFDSVFGPQADQADIFEEMAPFATSVLDGFNVCIFAYGQTGTGKTFTMEGTKEAPGVNFRTLEKMFNIIKARQKLYHYEVSVSVLEVYNEQIRDLLGSGNQPGTSNKRLEIRQAGEGVNHVPGLVEAHVNNMTEVWDVLQSGSNARAVSSTASNEHSSRSHCIHCVMVKGENLLNGECTRSKLWLVDLAGSERVAKTEVQGERLKETQNINRSLSALGDVISALATKSQHIPFRNSKLTHLLQDSLGGDSKTLMFVQISPNENDLSETICSLNFASRVRGIELGPAKRQLDTIELLKYKLMAEKTKQEVKMKDLQIKKMEETIHGLESKIKERDARTKLVQDKIKELESQLLIERKAAASQQHVDTEKAEKHQEQNKSPLRPALTNQPGGSKKNFNDDQANLTRPITENNSLKPSLPFSTIDNTIMNVDIYAEKENILEMAEKPLLPKRTGRVSICTMTPSIPSANTLRRNSLIPLPSAAHQLTQNRADQKEVNSESESNGLPLQSHCESPKEIRGEGRKKGSKLRRSLLKKNQEKSQTQQNIRKVGVSVGMEKVRVSVGSRGKMGKGRAGTKERQQQKNSQKEKERRWNVGTLVKTII